MLGAAVSACLEGASDEHAFVAQYDADNLDSNTPNNNQAQLQVPPTCLDELKRDTATPQIVPLTLRLKRPCPLWCPRLDALVPAAESSAEASFKELVALSKAATVHIALNRKWLTDEHTRLLQVINSGSEALSGYSVARYYSNFFNKADWTIFRPESPTKRLREVSTPSSPPDYKRIDAKRSPYSTEIPSPTEVATSPSHSQIAGLLGLHPQGTEDENDFQFQAISRVVERDLPGLVQQLLPDVVKQNLPYLFTLPITLPSYTSDLDTPSPPKSSTMPYPCDLTPLGAALMPLVFDHLQPQVQHMISYSLNRGVDSRQRQALLEIGEEADEKITEMHMERDRGIEDVEAERERGMDDLRHETKEGVEALQQEKEEGLDDLHRHAEEVLDELREDAASVGKWALDHVDTRITDRADEIVAAAREQLGTIRDKAIREIKGETILLRGQHLRQRAGKGGYRGLRNR